MRQAAAAVSGTDRVTAQIRRRMMRADVAKRNALARLVSGRGLMRPGAVHPQSPASLRDARGRDRDDTQRAQISCERRREITGLRTPDTVSNPR